jgi:hypothetical protein
MSFVVIFIPHQLTLGCVVERHLDHIRLLYDLLDGTTLAQEIVVSPIFLVTEIIVIEHHKLDSTFLYVSFRSQSLLNPTSNQIDYDTN